MENLFHHYMVLVTVSFTNVSYHYMVLVSVLILHYNIFAYLHQILEVELPPRIC
jgi:hypothetical protein